MDKQRLRKIAATVFVWILCVGLGGFFILTGGLKLYSPLQESIQVISSGVPSMFALPFVVVLASLEVFAGILLIVPGWRRAGAILTALLLVAFMGYMGIHYKELKGSNCGCLPGVHESLGPGFFIRDGAMLLAAIAIFPLAGAFRQRPRAMLRPLLVLLVILGIGVGSATLESSLHAGDQLLLKVQDPGGGVSSMPLSPRTTTLLYFYNPTCMDCKAAAEEIGKLKLTAPLVVVPSQFPEAAYDYLKQRGIKNAVVSLDYTALDETKFHLKRVPIMFVMQGAQPKAVIIDFRPGPLRETLRSHGVLG